MNVSTRQLYYDWLGNGSDGGCFYNPTTGKQTYGIDIPRLDWIRVRVAITTGRAKIDPTTRLPLLRYRLPITEYSSSVFVLKTKANYYGDGNLTFSNGGGYDTSDTAWNGAADGCFTLAPIVVPLTVLSTEYFSEIVMFTAAGVRWTLRPSSSSGLQPPACTVLRDVFSGAESNAPSGLPGGMKGTWTISGAAVSYDVSVPNCTAACQLALGVLPSTNAGDPGTISQVPIINALNPSLNVVRLTVGASPGTGGTFSGPWTLLSM